MADIAKLRLALQITENAAKNSLWNQDTWLAKTTCGTVGCFAGHWALHRGWEPIFLRRDEEEIEETTVVNVPGTGHTYIGAIVADDLGLDRDQAEMLFAESNDLDDMRNIIDLIEAQESLIVDLTEHLEAERHALV